MPMDPRVSYGVAVLLWRGDELLLHKRKGAHAAGHWSCPGGWVDFGEDSVVAVARELHEELGLRFGTDTTHAHFRCFREERHTRTPPDLSIQSLSLYYSMSLVDGAEPKIMEPDKCDELRWINIHDKTTWPTPLFPGLESVLLDLRFKHAEVQMF